MPSDPTYLGTQHGARIIVETDDGRPWAGTITDVIRSADGQAHSYAWRPDTADIPGDPWRDTPDAFVVTAAAEVSFVGDPEVLPNAHGNTATAFNRIELDVSPGPPEWEDQPVVDAVVVRCANGVAHVHDIAHGAIDIPADRFIAALRLEPRELIDRIRQASPRPTLAGDEPAVTLAALATLHEPVLPDAPALPLTRLPSDSAEIPTTELSQPDQLPPVRRPPDPFIPGSADFTPDAPNADAALGFDL
jgi:hypothetical protein